MDNLKLMQRNKEELQKKKKHMQIVRTFSDDIHMEYGLENWAKTTQEGKISSLTKFSTT